jgi:hypothetical protein
MRLAHLSLSLALTCLPAAAGTWIVDDDGPADFSNIQDAIDAAAPGDVILVLGGSYPGFVLDTAVTVLGQPGVVVHAPVSIEGVSDGPFAVLSNLQLEDLDVFDCSSTIVIDEVATLATQSYGDEIRVLNSLDVRFRKLTGTTTVTAPLQLTVNGARAEVADSHLHGWKGKDCHFSCPLDPNCIPTSGKPAVLVSGTTGAAHLYRTTATGGNGGVMCFICCDGKGGPAVQAGSGSETLIAGQAGQVLEPGCSPSCGPVLSVTGFMTVARVSGVTLSGTVQTSGGGSVQYPPLADPTLHILEQVGAGGTLTFRVNAPVGSSAALNVGRFPDLVPVSGISEDLLVKVLRTFELGPVDANGVVGFNFLLPGYLTTGSTFFAQARVTLPDGSTRYTNSAPMIVR